MSIHVVITDCPWQDNSIERKILEEGGAQVTRAQCTTPDEVIQAGGNADALLVGWAPITKQVVTSLTRCRLLMRYGSGHDNIDVEAATQAGMAVAINAEYCVEEVATHALSLLLACHRQLPALQDAARRGIWDSTAIMLPMAALCEQVVGCVGFGRIGRCLARMVRPLVKQVLVHDPALVEGIEVEAQVRVVPLNTLLAESDYVSIHVPLIA